MRLTHLADYAVVMMTAAARRDPGERWSASEIAGETGVPAPTAQKITQLLAKADLLDSQRGATGGYSLARPVPEISLADIIEAVEGPIHMTQCSETGISDCALDHHCKVKPHMNIVGAKVRGALSAVSLQELAQ